MHWKICLTACNQINTTDATSGVGTAYHSEESKSSPSLMELMQVGHSLVFCVVFCQPLISFSGVRVTRSLVLCVCFVDRCLSFCAFSFRYCVVCPASIYDSDYPFDIFNLFLP